MRCVHYGSSEYKKNSHNPIKDRPFRNKPLGGLWGSPVDSQYGWEAWCRSEEFNTDKLDLKFEFEVKGKIFVIDGKLDLELLDWTSEDFLCSGYPIFEPLANSYDAVYLTRNGEVETRFGDKSLYGWDCECVLVMNPDCVYPVHKKSIIHALY